jgi:hypothetical protein
MCIQFQFQLNIGSTVFFLDSSLNKDEGIKNKPQLQVLFAS